MKRVALFAAAGALLAGLMIGSGAGKTETGVYPRSGIVTGIDRGADVVTWTDAAGLDWSFYGVEDWMIGDGVAALMDDNGTAIVTDDAIVAVRFAG